MAARITLHGPHRRASSIAAGRAAERISSAVPARAIEVARVRVQGILEAPGIVQALVAPVQGILVVRGREIVLAPVPGREQAPETAAGLALVQARAIAVEQAQAPETAPPPAQRIAVPPAQRAALSTA
jgi:hypothetical protein